MYQTSGIAYFVRHANKAIPMQCQDSVDDCQFSSQSSQYERVFPGICRMPSFLRSFYGVDELISFEVRRIRRFLSRLASLRENTCGILLTNHNMIGARRLKIDRYHSHHRGQMFEEPLINPTIRIQISISRQHRALKFLDKCHKHNFNA